MRYFKVGYRISELVSDADGSLVLVKDTKLDNVAELNEAVDSSLCFYENEKYLSCLAELNAGLVVVPKDFNPQLLPKTNLFLTEKPYYQFNTLVYKWLQTEDKDDKGHIHPSVSINKDCIIDKSVILKENVVIGKSVKIGEGTIIEANSVIADKVSIGRNNHIFPNVSIYADTVISDNVIIHSGAVIGSDGFGYIFHDNKQQKVNHIGKVIIHNDVEIGANSCIDRSTIGDTVIGEGTKIDNLVQVGHNCKIGKHSILCAQVGLAGNTEIGNYVYLAGQVGAAGHLKIDDGAMVGAQSGVGGNVPAGKKYFGTPAIDAGLQKRIIVSLRKLPEMLKHFNKQNKNED